jgi:hypothetical protein
MTALFKHCKSFICARAQNMMNAFIKMPVDQWLSAGSYMRCFVQAVETSADNTSPSINTKDRINASRGTLEALQRRWMPLTGDGSASRAALRTMAA